QRTLTTQQLVEDLPLAVDSQLRHRQVAGYNFPAFIAPPQNHRPVQPNRLYRAARRLREELLRAVAPALQRSQCIEHARQHNQRRARAVSSPPLGFQIVGLQRFQLPSRAALSARDNFESRVANVESRWQRPTAAACSITKSTAVTLLFTTGKLQ